MNTDEGYNSSGKDVRKGKWTVEEENYSNKIISMFNQGLLFIPAGTTLRSYLSEKLSCDPMRITKKFAGASCIGKQVFHPCEQTEANNQLRKEGMIELQQLEYAFLHRLRSKSAAVAQLVEKFVPSQSPGGGRGVKNKHNPSLSTSSMMLEKSNSFTLGNEQDRLRTASSESGGYLVVKSEETAGVEDFHGFQKNKRIMSAPDLTLLLSNEGLKASDSSSKLSELAYSPGSSFLLGSSAGRKTTPRGRVRTGSGAKLSRDLNDSFTGSGGGIAQQAHHNSLRMAKKYHSQMDLAHYEKLATDDMAAGNLFLNFMQTLGDKYHTPHHAAPQLSPKSYSVDQLNLLSQVSAAATATAVHTNAGAEVTSSAASGNATEAFMTIDEVISSTVTQDFSSFSVSDVKVPSPFSNNFNSTPGNAIPAVSSTTNSSRCVSVLSSHSPLLLSNPDLVSLNPIMMTNKEVLAISHTSVQSIEHLDRAAFDYNKNTNGSASNSSGISGVLESAPIFVDQSVASTNVATETGGGFVEDSNFF